MEFWNWLDIFSMFTCLFLTCCFVAETETIDIDVMRLLAAFASCALMLKFGDWLRLFDGTGFFIELLV